MKKLNGEEPRKLAAVTLRNTKPTDKIIRLTDGYGLFLKVRPTGAKYWRYRFRFLGKQKDLALGVFPEISLAEARAMYREAYNLLAEGIDPTEQKADKKAKERRELHNTFELVAREWLKSKILGKKSVSHEKRCVGLLENQILPVIGNRPIARMRKEEVVAPLKRMQDAGIITSGHKARQVINQVFDYASASGYINTIDKLVALDGISGVLDPLDKSSNFAAVTSPVELAGLLRILDESTSRIVVKTAILLVPMLFQRPNEIASMEWSELKLDQERWEIPASKMKLGKDHIVPLPRQAIALLRNLQPVTGHGRYVFPNARSGKRHMTGEAILAGIRSMGIAKETTTSHGFRATARTILDEVLEQRVDWIEHQQSHAVKDPNGRAYNRTSYLQQRAAMMQLWADYLDELRAVITETEAEELKQRMLSIDANRRESIREAAGLYVA